MATMACTLTLYFSRVHSPDVIGVSNPKIPNGKSRSITIASSTPFLFVRRVVVILFVHFSM